MGIILIIRIRDVGESARALPWASQSHALLCTDQTMDGRKSDQVWVPDPVEGYRLGFVVDVGAETLTIKLQDSTEGVGLEGALCIVYC